MKLIPIVIKIVATAAITSFAVVCIQGIYIVLI